MNGSKRRLDVAVLLPPHPPDRGVGAPSLAIAAPAVRLEAPDLRLGAPALHVPVSLDLAVHFAEGRSTTSPTSPPRAPGSQGAGPARPDPLPPVAEVFAHLRARLASELTTRFGGMP